MGPAGRRVHPSFQGLQQASACRPPAQGTQEPQSSARCWEFAPPATHPAVRRELTRRALHCIEENLALMHLCAKLLLIGDTDLDDR